MAPSKYWEDFKAGFTHTTAAVTVTEAHIVNFACLTGDWYPLHMDAEAASQSMYGGRIAHGPLIFSLTSGLVVMSGILGDAPIAFLGTDKLRTPAPVKLGDTIHVEVQVLETRETKKPDRGAAVLVYTTKNQRDETVMTMEMSMLMRRRQ